MKKLILAAAIAVFGLSNAQFKLGAHVGLPVGDASNGSSFALGVDAAYMWPVASEFNLGIASGYSAWLGKNGAGTLSSVPVAVSAEYKFTPEFSLGVDLGYAFMFASGFSDGGFYYQPKVAYHFGPSEVNLGYVGISKNGFTTSSVNVGYAYTFGK